jgi:hypothetical protein
MLSGRKITPLNHSGTLGIHTNVMKILEHEPMSVKAKHEN